MCASWASCCTFTISSGDNAIRGKRGKGVCCVYVCCVCCVCPFACSLCAVCCAKCKDNKSSSFMFVFVVCACAFACGFVDCARVCCVCACVSSMSIIENENTGECARVCCVCVCSVCVCSVTEFDQSGCKSSSVNMAPIICKQIQNNVRKHVRVLCVLIDVQSGQKAKKLKSRPIRQRNRSKITTSPSHRQRECIPIKRFAFQFNNRNKAAPFCMKM